MILQNQAKCRVCGDLIFSRHRHDFVQCSCGAISVDGGMDYLKRGGHLAYIEEKSIIVNDDAIKDILTELDENGDKYTELGRLCLILRTLQAHGYDLVEGEG